MQSGPLKKDGKSKKLNTVKKLIKAFKLFSMNSDSHLTDEQKLASEALKDVPSTIRDVEYTPVLDEKKNGDMDFDEEEPELVAISEFKKVRTNKKRYTHPTPALLASLAKKPRIDKNDSEAPSHLDSKELKAEDSFLEIKCQELQNQVRKLHSDRIMLKKRLAQSEAREKQHRDQIARLEAQLSQKATAQRVLRPLSLNFSKPPLARTSSDNSVDKNKAKPVRSSNIRGFR